MKEIKVAECITLRSLDWQMHVYGQIQSDFSKACDQLGLQIQVFPWSEQAESAGLQRNAAYLVRPDGYVSLANGNQGADALIDFVDRFTLRFFGIDNALTDAQPPDGPQTALPRRRKGAGHPATSMASTPISMSPSIFALRPMGLTTLPPPTKETGPPYYYPVTVR